jgi:hypothetical protein
VIIGSSQSFNIHVVSLSVMLPSIPRDVEALELQVFSFLQITSTNVLTVDDPRDSMTHLLSD